MNEPNKRKQAFREEAVKALGELDRDPTYNDVRTAHKLDCFECALHDENLTHPKSQNCRDNPYCINRLGLEKFSKLLKSEQQKAEKVEKEMDKRDIHAVPCGLTNEGNFCYVNSFLQVFFNDPIFRQVVYNWCPSPDFVRPLPPKMDVEAVMSSMQKIFFFMEFTPLTDSSTHDFTPLLRLGNLQQDAQEFTLMFLAALERNLPAHPNGQPVIDLIKNRFYGKIMNRTWCECGGRDNKEYQPFMSIQLPIEGHNTIPKAIEKHFEVERLHECRCSACGRQDQVSRKSEIVELPDVLIVQLNRYINDMTKMCQRKLKSPIAYPRAIRAKTLQPSLQDNMDFEYELFAVMIHEGDQTHCGHYYDLIKHPHMNEWFKYNDEVVEKLPKPPGYDKIARFNAAKASSDMKTCYGLIYRRKEPIHQCEQPLSSICEPWRNEFDAQYSSERGEEITKSSRSVRDVKTRYTDLNNVFSNLKAHTDRYKNEKHLAFIPLTLLTDVIEKECEYAKKQLKEIKTVEKVPEEDSEPQTKTNKQSNGTSSPVKRKEKAVKISREEIAGTLTQSSMNLCPHGLISMESVLYGDVKIVSRVAVENLLSRYNFAVKKTSADTEEDANLFTGADLCLDCAKRVQAEAQFKKRLETTVKLTTKILREKHRDSTNTRRICPPDHYFVSKKTLMNFRKLAEQHFRFDTWLDDDKLLLFLPGGKPFIAPSEQPTLMSGTARTRKRRYDDSCNADGDVVPTTNGTNGTDQHDVKELIESLVQKVCNISASEGDEKDATKKIEVAVENGETATESRPSTPPTIKPDEVVFNQALSCSHGKVNIPEYRFAVSPEEWDELKSFFSSFFEVRCGEPVCPKCINAEEEMTRDVAERTQQKKELKQQLGELIRVAERRLPPLADIGTKYKYGICTAFIMNMKNAFRRNIDTFELPTMCQECIICDLHQRPFKPVITSFDWSADDSQIIPITEKEWELLISKWPEDRIGEAIPVVLLKGGGIQEFCGSCFDDVMQVQRLQRLTFDNEFIYVKVVSADAVDEPVVEVRPGQRGSRRNNQKDVHKFKMSHTNTVKELKIKLYEKTHQTPMDQMLYNGEALLENDQTLYDAMIEPNNVEKPLKLIVTAVTNSPTKFLDEEREPEIGFTGTALTT